MKKYKCLDCGYEFEGKRKRKCPKCKSTNIQVIEKDAVEEMKKMVKDDETIKIEDTNEDELIRQLEMEINTSEKTKIQTPQENQFFREAESQAIEDYDFGLDHLYGFIGASSDIQISKKQVKTLSKFGNEILSQTIGNTNSFIIKLIIFILMNIIVFLPLFAKKKQKKRDKNDEKQNTDSSEPESRTPKDWSFTKTNFS